MSEKKAAVPPARPPCPGCGGSGQTSYFGGESRFMFTWEDCPDCCGTGLVLEEIESRKTDESQAPDTQNSS